MTKLEDYAHLHWEETRTWDIDPHYPILKHIGDTLPTQDDKAWLTLRHAAFYHLGSTLRSYTESPGPNLPNKHLTLPVSSNRRGFRVPQRLRQHWDHLLTQIEQAGGPANYLTPTTTGTQGWQQIFTKAQHTYGNGRYFAYKIAELSKEVMGHNITAPDAGHTYSTGPRRGLAWLHPNLPQGNNPQTINTLNQITTQLAQTIGEPAIERVETSLCAFDSLNKGRNYLGLYIDEQQHQLNQTPSDLTQTAYNARQQHIPNTYLGELNGWHGIQKQKLTTYRDERRLITPWPEYSY